MTLELTHSALHRAAHDLDAAAEQLRDAERSAHRRVAGFVGAGWTGEAADAFLEAWESWRRGADEVRTGLTATRRLLVATHRDLSDTDDTAGQRLQTVAGRLLERLG